MRAVTTPSQALESACQAPRLLADGAMHENGRKMCGQTAPDRGGSMAAMKPRTGDGPLEVTKEGRGYVMRVPLEGGGRLVVELNAQEVGDLGDALKAVLS